MDELNNVEETTAPTAEPITPEPSQDPLDVEIEKGKEEKRQFTEAEKAAFNLKKNAERAKELGVDPATVLGLSQETQTEDDDVPEWYKKREAQAASKTALELAEAIEDPRERELVKMKLETVITSGSPEERVRIARGYVNSVRNGQIAEEVTRAKAAPAFGNGAGAPANKAPAAPELSAAELPFTRPPFNMTPAEIIAKRPQE
jgi:nucleotide-binding universal stress UspA family protein